jgi:hypothetical protein
MDNVPLFYERLIVLVGLVIGAIAGVGLGVLLGQVELLGFTGAAVGLVLGIVGVVRFNRLNSAKAAAPPGKRTDPRSRARKLRR